MGKVGITFSSFDLFHAGHVLMLKEAKKQCDYLIVGLQLDPSIERLNKKKPVQSIFERYIQIKGSKYVDEIIPYVFEHEIELILKSYKIDIRIIGEEYKNKEFSSKKFCKNNDIKIYYNSRRHDFSSSKTRNQAFKSNFKISK